MVLWSCSSLVLLAFGLWSYLARKMVFKKLLVSRVGWSLELKGLWSKLALKGCWSLELVGLWSFVLFACGVLCVGGVCLNWC